MEILFWTLLSLVIYTYLGYPISLIVLKKIFPKRGSENVNLTEMPTMTFVVAAYNEEPCIREKIENTLQLNYDQSRFSIVFVTDGSSDETHSIISEYPSIRLFHQDKRQGKIAAINRIMPYLDSEVVVLSDANTILNNDALMWMGNAYRHENVGAVSGEKVVLSAKSDDATSGEGIYWRYESMIKKWDSDLNTMVGCAGELMSFRRRLYEPVEPDTYIEDFVMSMRIASKGYRVVYCPQAKAHELSSANIQEEMKRKVRIAAGGLQAIYRLRSLLNPFKYGLLTYQYFGHRVLRWSLTPASLLLLPFLNILLSGTAPIYQALMMAQTAFYFLAILGAGLKHTKIKVKGLFIPYYFVIMNYAVFLGLGRLIKGAQTVTWEKAERKVAF